MAKFAEIVNGIVKQVILIGDLDILKDGVIDEVIGAEFCHNLFGGEWVQTKDDYTLRYNYAGIGDTYDTVRDAFIATQPYPSWVLDEATCRWEPPVARPSAGGPWSWNEATLSWTESAQP